MLLISMLDNMRYPVYDLGDVRVMEESIMQDNRATPEDARLILYMYELRREEKLRRARDWFMKMEIRSAEQYDRECPAGSEQNSYFRMLATYWDMVASFLNYGALNKELFYESGMEMLFVWDKIRPLLPIMRERSKNPTMLANYEKAVTEFAEWGQKHADRWWGYKVIYDRTPQPAERLGD